MSNPQIYAGFIGYAQITSGSNNYTVRCSDFNVGIKQEVKFYDHPIGLRDSALGGLLTANGDNGDNGSNNAQKLLYRAGVKICDGNMGFPLTNISGKALFSEAVLGSSFILAFHYDCKRYRQFTGCKVDSYTLSATSGDIVTVSAGIKATSLASDTSTGTFTPYIVDEKILTWDTITITGLSGHIIAFEVSVNNGVMPIYTAGKNMGNPGNLEPLKLRVGMQQVSGHFTFYSPDGLPPKYIEDATNNPLAITIDMGGIFKINLNILFPYPEINGKIDTMIQTYRFVGMSMAIDIGQ